MAFAGVSFSAGYGGHIYCAVGISLQGQAWTFWLRWMNDYETGRVYRVDAMF